MNLYIFVLFSPFFLSSTLFFFFSSMFYLQSHFSCSNQYSIFKSKLNEKRKKPLYLVWSYIVIHCRLGDTLNKDEPPGFFVLLIHIISCTQPVLLHKTCFGFYRFPSQELTFSTFFLILYCLSKPSWIE